MSEALVRGMAHALSNRIATIGTIAELLRVSAEDPAAMSEMLGIETRRLEDLLEQMRALSARHSGAHGGNAPLGCGGWRDGDAQLSPGATLRSR